MTSQLNNFRKSLGLPLRDEERNVIEEPKPYHSVAVKPDNYLRFRALSLWLMREGKISRPVFDKVFGLVLEAYLAANPEAAEFVKQCLEKRQISVSRER
jgi:hypothetical protein